MPLSLNEIKDRALAFSLDWEGAKAERAEAQTFWNDFFNVFGMTRRGAGPAGEDQVRKRQPCRPPGFLASTITVLLGPSWYAQHLFR